MYKYKIIINYSRFFKWLVFIFLFSINQLSLAALKRVIKVHVYPSFNYTRIMIESNYILKYKQFILSKPERLVIDLKEINFNSVLKKLSSQISTDDPYIKSARVGQFDSKTVRMVFELKKNIKLQLFTLAPIAGFRERLIIDLYSKTATDLEDPLITLLKEYDKRNLQHQMLYYKNNVQSFTKRSRWCNNQIVIMLDPGHGGKDLGAVGKYYTREKDVVLQIARKLKFLIENESNMRAYMTRNEDVFIPLEMRVAKAQKQNADLFVSIHANAFTSRQPSGSSVFALSNKGVDSTALKYLTNDKSTFNLVSNFNKNNDRYLYYTMFDMLQSLTVNDSLKFGRIVLNKLSKINKLHKNKVEQVGFAVLKAPDIPSILIETAFISNIEEEQKLKTAKFQQKLAESILAGIKDHFARQNKLSLLCYK